jgi:alkyl sulfatase BDS1-like metallo-beta-lactamase superfamily hydrolase
LVQILSAELYNWAGLVEKLMSIDPELAEFAALAELADSLDDLSRQVSTAARRAGYVRNARETLDGLY